VKHAADRVIHLQLREKTPKNHTSFSETASAVKLQEFVYIYVHRIFLHGCMTELVIPNKADRLLF